MKKFRKCYMFMFTIGIVLMITMCPAFAADIESGLNKLDTVGFRFLHMAQQIGFWIVNIKCTYDIGRCALKADRRAVGDTIITYLMIYGAMFFVPWSLQFIEDMFQ